MEYVSGSLGTLSLVSNEQYSSFICYSRACYSKSVFFCLPFLLVDLFYSLTVQHTKMCNLFLKDSPSIPTFLVLWLSDRFPSFLPEQLQTRFVTILLVPVFNDPNWHYRGLIFHTPFILN